jgi:hypothetical protein
MWCGDGDGMVMWCKWLLTWLFLKYKWCHALFQFFLYLEWQWWSYSVIRVGILMHFFVLSDLLFPVFWPLLLTYSYMLYCVLYSCHIFLLLDVNLKLRIVHSESFLKKIALAQMIDNASYLYVINTCGPLVSTKTYHLTLFWLSSIQSTTGHSITLISILRFIWYLNSCHVHYAVSSFVVFWRKRCAYFSTPLHTLHARFISSSMIL